jgi:hypothetical protein
MNSNRFPMLQALVIAASCALGACATGPWADARPASRTGSDSAAAPVSAADVVIYDSSEISPVRYRLIQRFWVDTWRTAWWLPMHADADNGIAALKADAARLGANGLLNVACRRESDFLPWFTRPGVVCSGDAIRVL